jgi:hypothetical protein
MIFIFSVLLWTFPAYGLVIEGPALNYAEGNWSDFGLLIRAEADVMLASVRFPNQGLADVIQLIRVSDGAILASIETPAGSPDVIVDINCPLNASETYRLVATTPNNRFYASSGTPAGNEAITVMSSYGVLLYDDTEHTLQGYWFSFNDITTQPKSIQATQAVIDVKPGPGDYPKSINLRSKGLVPVAILSTEDFDAYSVAPDSVEFAGASPTRWVIKDVDGDGINDLMLYFKTGDLFRSAELSGLSGSTEVTLTGNTSDGIPFEGGDTVNVVPVHK